MDCSPSRVRWRIAALLFAISVVTYIDRVNISVTARQMMPALGLTDVQMGHVFSAFFLGYALFQIPGGWLGDRWGPRRVLSGAVIWWSLFTALTAVAATLPIAALLGIGGSLMLVRFLIGIGEAAALPTFNRTVANWLAPQERGFGISLAIGGIGVGSALTPPVTAWLMVNFGWQTAFYASSAIGFLIAGAWYVYARDRPTEHPHVNAAEAALIAGKNAAPRRNGEAAPGWPALIRFPTTWWLILSYSCLGYVANIFMSWFYLYVVNIRGFGEMSGAFLASEPFLIMAASCPLGGWVTDRLVGRVGTTRGRAWAGAAGMLLAALSILIGAAIDSPALSIAFLSIGAGWLYFAVGAYWSSTVDISKAHAGTLSGVMNTGANLGGVVSASVTPWLAGVAGWSWALALAALVALLGALMWLGINPGARPPGTSLERPMTVAPRR
ncbi:MFS transporter [Candidatus Nitrospira bockiana]